MPKYLITNSMKRHERSGLCLKLFNEMLNSHKLYHLSKPLGKIIEGRIKGQNKFRPSKEPIFAITRSVYKGIPFYIFLDKEQKLQVVFNTSPIDASYVEFIRIIGTPNTESMVYTQHALDRYNERAHGRKYDNYKDIMKRLILNNPMKHSYIVAEDNKITMRTEEGFLCGSADPVHKVLTMNTFFDSADYEDNKYQHAARTMYDCVSKFTPAQRAIYDRLMLQWSMGEITKEGFVEQFSIEVFGTVEIPDKGIESSDLSVKTVGDKNVDGVGF